MGSFRFMVTWSPRRDAHFLLCPRNIPRAVWLEYNSYKMYKDCLYSRTLWVCTMFLLCGLDRNSSIFLYHSRMWYLLKCISPITELLILQTRPVVMSFLDLDLSPSQNEKPSMSPNKLSIKVILSVEYVDYKTPKKPTNLSAFSLGVEIQGTIIVPYSGKDRKMYPRP